MSRNHRLALKGIIYAAALGVATLVISNFSFGAPAPTHQETTWTSSATHDTPQPTELLTSQSLQPLAVFADDVAASEASTTSTSPSGGSTTIATSVTPSGPTSQSSESATVSAYAEWTQVAVCEEGGWIGSAGAAYPDSLGIDAANWYANGGGSDLSPGAQIAVAQAIEAAVGTPGYVPDQGYCASW